MHAILTLLFGSYPTVMVVVAIGDLLAILAIPSVLLRRSGRPVAALSWVLALIAFPYIGIALCWMFGRIRMERRINSRREAVQRFCKACKSDDEQNVLSARLKNVVPFAVAGARWSEGVFTPSVVSDVTVLCDGEKAFRAMESLIDIAQNEIRVQFYIWKADETGKRIATKLAQKARDGVRVRILVDAVGGRPFLAAFSGQLRKSGIEIAVSLPLQLMRMEPRLHFRNHRKLLLVDGNYAFFGGMNLGDEYAMDWHDLAFSVRGPIVHTFDEVFREDWFVATGSTIASIPPPTSEITEQENDTAVVIASGPERDEARVHDLFFQALVHSSKRVWLTTPYFVPSESVMSALRGAAQRGVDVRILVPKTSDVPIVDWASRSFLPEAMRAGVRVFEYQPRISHSKAVVIDHDLAIVGSANTDVRSFKLNFELACVFESKKLNRDLTEIFRDDFAESVEFDLGQITNRPMGTTLAESAAHLLSPLL